MDASRLSLLLDSIIAEIVAQRTQRLAPPRPVMRAIVSGEDLTTLPATLDCLAALDRNGYQLVIAFSHSAMQSPLRAACLEALAHRGIDVLCDNQPPQETDAPWHGLYLPALSSNSLSKIALGIRDNLVCRWAFHALRLNKPVVATLNAECQSDAAFSLPAALRTRLANYAATLAAYGISVIGQRPTQQILPTSAKKPLITRSDVRCYAKGAALHVPHHTLITPAALDEIRDRGITIVRDGQEETCIWPG